MAYLNIRVYEFKAKPALFHCSQISYFYNNAKQSASKAARFCLKVVMKWLSYTSLLILIVKLPCKIWITFLSLSACEMKIEIGVGEREYDQNSVQFGIIRRPLWFARNLSFDKRFKMCDNSNGESRPIYIVITLSWCAAKSSHIYSWCYLTIVKPDNSDN